MLRYAPSIIDVDDKIVSTDIITSRFACDLSVCKGACCIEGDSGAPLEKEEIEILEREYDNYKEYMVPEGISELERQGFTIVDCDGDYITPLINGTDECVFAFRENGVLLCAVEKAYREGKCSFAKPISCHLYPIRVKKFANGTYGLSYHRWGICDCAVECGKKLDMPIYKMLKEPITRRFGADFYEALEAAAGYLASENED